MLNFSYLADGTKFSALDNEGNGLLYRGSLIYQRSLQEVPGEQAPKQVRLPRMPCTDIPQTEITRIKIKASDRHRSEALSLNPIINN